MYVHRITDERMSAKPKQNLHMFEELTGSRSAKNVVLATTMWDRLHPQFDDGNKREKDLEKKYWNVMIHHGATAERFLNTPDSAWSIIANVVKRNKHQKAVLLIQEETVGRKQPLLATAAGKALYLGFDRLLERQNKTMQEPTVWNSSSGSVILDAQEYE